MAPRRTTPGKKGKGPAPRQGGQEVGAPEQGERPKRVVKPTSKAQQAVEASTSKKGNKGKSRRGSITTQLLYSILDRLEARDHATSSRTPTEVPRPAIEVNEQSLREDTTAATATQEVPGDSGISVASGPDGELVSNTSTTTSHTVAGTGVQGGSTTAGQVAGQVWGFTTSPSTQTGTGQGTGLENSVAVPSRGESTIDPRVAVDPRYFPWGGIATPLGFHLLPATKEKIWKGEYIDLFSLLYREKAKGDKEEDKDKAWKTPKVDKTLSSWQYAFAIYHSVVLEKDISRAPALIKYQDMILRTYHDFGGTAWLQYDETFRMRAAFDKSLPWDRACPDLWLQCTQLSQSTGSARAHSGHVLLSREQEIANALAAVGKGVQTSLKCFDFAAKGVCNRTNCRFQHACGTCGGGHATSACAGSKASKFPRETGKGYKPPPGQNLGKGPQAN